MCWAGIISRAPRHIYWFLCSCLCPQIRISADRNSAARWHPPPRRTGRVCHQSKPSCLTSPFNPCGPQRNKQCNKRISKKLCPESHLPAGCSLPRLWVRTEKAEPNWPRQKQVWVQIPSSCKHFPPPPRSHNKHFLSYRQMATLAIHLWL